MHAIIKVQKGKGNKKTSAKRSKRKSKKFKTRGRGITLSFIIRKVSGNIGYIFKAGSGEIIASSFGAAKSQNLR